MPPLPSTSTAAAHSPADGRLYTTRAVCLKRFAYGESDWILHLYSAELGRVNAIAKGAKKAGSKLSGACEILSLCDYHLSRGKSGGGQSLHTLSQYQAVESFAHLRGDLLKLGFSQVFAELVHRAGKEHDTDSALIFSLLYEHLDRLNHAAISNQAENDTLSVALASRFQLLWLEAIGYQPSLVHCVVSGEPLEPGQPYYAFSPSLGGAVLPHLKRQAPAPDWVNVSSQTLFALAGVAQAADNASILAAFAGTDPGKSQRFLRFYIEKKLEYDLRAYDFALSLLPPPSTETGA